MTPSRSRAAAVLSRAALYIFKSVFGSSYYLCADESVKGSFFFFFCSDHACSSLTCRHHSSRSLFHSRYKPGSESQNLSDPGLYRLCLIKAGSSPASGDWHPAAAAQDTRIEPVVLLIRTTGESPALTKKSEGPSTLQVFLFRASTGKRNRFDSGVLGRCGEVRVPARPGRRGGSTRTSWAGTAVLTFDLEK
jgi:hypothetical protein